MALWAEFPRFPPNDVIVVNGVQIGHEVCALREEMPVELHVFNVRMRNLDEEERDGHCSGLPLEGKAD